MEIKVPLSSGTISVSIADRARKKRENNSKKRRGNVKKLLKIFAIWRIFPSLPQLYFSLCVQPTILAIQSQSEM